MQLLCNVNAAAEALGVSRRTIERMLSDGRLTPRTVPGVKGRRVSVGELERIAKGDEPNARLAEPMSKPQQAAYRAKCRHYSRLTGDTEAEVYKVVLGWCSRQFGRAITSTTDLTWDEAHQMLDELQSWVEGTEA